MFWAMAQAPSFLSSFFCYHRSWLSFPGMSFKMLKSIIERMKLKLQPTLLRQMYNIMDVNHDGSLDLGELIDGMQVLFNRLLPLRVMQVVEVAEDSQLLSILLSIIALCIFFAFVGVAFSSFMVSKCLYERQINCPYCAVSKNTKQSRYSTRCIAGKYNKNTLTTYSYSKQLQVKNSGTTKKTVF